jgi:hypothetical protein
MPFGPVLFANKRKDASLPQKIEVKIGGPQAKRRKQEREGFRDGENMKSSEIEDDSNNKTAYQLTHEGCGSCFLLGEESGRQSAGVKSSAYAWGVCSIQVRTLCSRTTLWHSHHVLIAPFHAELPVRGIVITIKTNGVSSHSLRQC